MALKMTMRQLRALLVNEISIDRVKGLRSTSGSTHQMNTARLVDDERKFFVKFSDIDPDLFNSGDPDPSMQCMSEYLAYRLYALYPGVKIPGRYELVFDPDKSRVGLATAAVSGNMALPSVSPQKLAKGLEAGAYVDIFMANYDVVGTGSGNLMSDPGGNEITRIDPGSAFKYRARGGRKGPGFNSEAGELKTMLDPKFGGGCAAGSVLQYADLKKAAKEFLAVPWSKVSAEVDRVKASVLQELEKNGMKQLAQEWTAEVDDIKGTLAGRHRAVSAHANSVLSGGALRPVCEPRGQ